MTYNRKIMGLTIIAVVALFHIFNVGNCLSGNLYTLYYSFASDIIVPFGLYFLLCIAELKIRLLKKWYFKATLILTIAISSEIIQSFGIYAFGKTFDYYDILMYLIGVGTAIILDRKFFKYTIANWDSEY